MTFTTATLTIGNFTTDLDLTDGPRRWRTAYERINVIGDRGADYWDKDPAPYFRRNADLLLAEHGYKRTADWTYDAFNNRHTAPITPADEA